MAHCTTVKRSVEALAIDQYRRVPSLHVVNEEAYLERFMELDNRGYTPKPQVFSNLVKALRLSASLAGPLEEDYFENYARFTIGFPGLHESLETLRGSGLRLGLDH